MKLLFVTPSLCYPNVPYAGELTIFKLMEQLALRGHELYLITGLRPGEREHLKKVNHIYTVLDAIDVPWSKTAIVKAAIQWMFRGFRYGLTFRKQAALSVDRFTQKIDFDIIEVVHTALGDYINKPDNVPTVITAIDVLLKPALREYQCARGIARLIRYMQYRRLMNKEIAVYQKFDLVYTLSDFDKQFLLSYKNDLHVARRSPYVKIADFKSSEAFRESKTILFVGAMDRPANIKAAQYFTTRVLPLLKREIPDVTLYIVGNKPPDEIKYLGARDPNVIVTGFVEDIKPFFLKATVFVAPLFIGGGIITKILDAMAAGLPVITSSIGNEGIDATADTDLLIANTPEDFANKVLLLIKDHRRWTTFSENGKAFVQKHFDWNKTVDQAEHDYKALRA
jgi:glycosyltransferase involved in cell wall biosynthesis